MSNLFHPKTEDCYIYFVTTNIYNQEKIFLNPVVSRLFIKEVNRLKKEIGFKIFAYVIMPDHVHLLILPLFDRDISYIMMRIKGTSARVINSMLGRTGQKLWQDEFYDYIPRNRNKVLEKIAYIHKNPVRKGLVECPEDYLFSSYRQFLRNGWI